MVSATPAPSRPHNAMTFTHLVRLPDPCSASSPSPLARVASRGLTPPLGSGLLASKSFGERNGPAGQPLHQSSWRDHRRVGPMQSPDGPERSAGAPIGRLTAAVRRGCASVARYVNLVAHKGGGDANGRCWFDPSARGSSRRSRHDEHRARRPVRASGP